MKKGIILMDIATAVAIKVMKKKQQIFAGGAVVNKRAIMPILYFTLYNSVMSQNTCLFRLVANCI